jgi:hypothetical protein
MFTQKATEAPELPTCGSDLPLTKYNERAYAPTERVPKGDRRSRAGYLTALPENPLPILERGRQWNRAADSHNTGNMAQGSGMLAVVGEEGLCPRRI